MSLPLHERIRREIEADILAGTLPPGARLPTELELMARHGCARMTVSKALSALATAGLVDRRKRAGSFVARPKVHSMVLDIPDLAVEVERRGQRYRYELLHRTVRAADPASPVEAALAGTGELLRIEGVHHADDRPLAVEDRLISLAAVPEIRAVDFGLISPGAWLLGHVPWTEAELRVAAVAAEGEAAARLDRPAGTACLAVERRTWRGADGITWVRQLLSGSDFDLVASFGPTRAG
ncbi:UTRA domain-containing protein [Sphingomonas sp. MG17]|uniref:UTRA domain-containing protein n=1 Tax=Sphingomonas tagetis TaxID=2949092 RepID=A0A9X2KKY7_9SPHN|nr:UTRA domain-containing protein [Sphingomonas tagetis]MCP3731004.1 UTRA domain-containing protein [Sphingomonas tagetis]